MAISSRNQGFTLVESLTVLAILAVVVGSVSASWSGIIARSERQSSLSELAAAFALARASAVHRGHTVTLCPLNEDRACSSDWSLPIAVFSDRQNSRQLTAQHDFIREFPAPTGGSFVPQPANKRYFQFRQDGMVRGTLGNVTFCPRDNQAPNAGRLIINMGGRVRLAQDNDGDGIVDGANGVSISC